MGRGIGCESSRPGILGFPHFESNDFKLVSKEFCSCQHISRLDPREGDRSFAYGLECLGENLGICDAGSQDHEEERSGKSQCNGE